MAHVAPEGRVMALINPGAANAGLYGRFRSRHGRDPNQSEIGQFKGAFNWDWNSDIDSAELDRGYAAIDAYQPGGPPPPPPPTPGPTTKPWSWSDVPDAPGFEFDEFSYGEFEAPTAEGMYADPGYQFRMQQGVKALEATKAGEGKYLSGETMRDLMTYGQGLASQEYGNVFNRAHTTYQTNRGNAADTWDRNFRLRQTEYAPQLATWDARTGAMRDREGLEFDRAWQREVYMNDDAFRKAVFASDDEFRRAVNAENNAWKRELMMEERLRFLAGRGGA
jgi:hypothetical protein